MGIYDPSRKYSDLDDIERMLLKGNIGSGEDQLWMAQHVYSPNDNKRTLVGRAGDPNDLFDLSEPEEPDLDLQLPRLNLTSNVSRSGSLGNNLGAISVQTPYLIISRPDLSLPENYGHYHGYPSNISRKINTLKGYTKVSDIHLDGINGTSTELVKLERALYNGFIIGTAIHADPAVFTLYKNNNAARGIIIANPTSFIKLDIVDINIIKTVKTPPVNFNNFFRIIVSSKPLDSAIPTPNNDINSILNGVKVIKLIVALLIKYVKPS